MATILRRFGRLDRRLFAGLIAVVLLACGAGRRQTGPAAPNAGRTEEGPKVATANTNEPALQTESAAVRGEENEEEALGFQVQEGLTYVQRGREIELIEPSSLAVLPKIGGPGRSLPACVVTHPAGHRFLLMYRSGLASLWESKGTLIAQSQKSIGRTVCGPSSLRVSWDSKDEYFLTNFDEDPSLPSTGAWVWRIEGTVLEPTLIAPGKQPRAELLEHSAGAWVERNDESFQIVTLDGKVLYNFSCEQCVPSPDGRQLAVNQFNPQRRTRLVDLKTGAARWESTSVSAHVWSPSMRWLLGTDDQGSVVIDASSGRTVARWAHPDGQPGEQARWFGDLLVETGGREIVKGLFGEEQSVNYQVAFWKGGDARPKIESGVPHEGLPEITLAHGGDRFLAANTIWSVQGKRLTRLEALAPTHGFAQSWSADDNYLEGSNDKGLVVWDARTGRIVSRLEHRMLQKYARSWSLQGHDLLINEGPTLIRHTPNKGTVRITPRLRNGQLAFDVHDVMSWFGDSARAED
jgi:WD40 repeat protein